MSGSPSRRVVIVLVNFNAWEKTLNCVASLGRLRHPYELCIVDNGSIDGSAEYLQEQVKEAVILRTRSNLGFAGGCNVGIRHAMERQADYVWLLNNDAVVDPNCLTAMVEAAEADSTIGAVGSGIFSLSDHQTVQVWGGGRVRTILGKAHQHQRRPRQDQLHYISGASMLCRVEALKEVGGLDSQFFLYWEDTDLCVRLRRAGWRLALASDARILHEGGGSIGKGTPLRDEYFNASAIRFYRLHARVPIVPIFLGATTRLGKNILLGRFRRAGAILRGIRRGFRNRETASR